MANVIGRPSSDLSAEQQAAWCGSYADKLRRQRAPRDARAAQLPAGGWVVVTGQGEIVDPAASVEATVTT